MKRLVAILPVWVALICCSQSNAQVESNEHDELIDSIIAKARAYIGGDEKLESIKTLTYKGTLLYSDGNTGSAEIIFKKPYFQRFVAVLGDMKETSGLDDLEAWRKQERVGYPDAASVSVYAPAEMYNMRASVWEYLNFYKRPQGRKKGVKFLDFVTIGDLECVVLRYDHGDGIWFDRFFDKETGKVVRMISSRGAMFIGEGELMVDGIRFPKKLTTVFLTLPDDQKIEMVYTSIQINKEFENEIFKYPRQIN